MKEIEIFVIVGEDRGCGAELRKGFISKEDAENELGSNEYIDSVFVTLDE